MMHEFLLLILLTLRWNGVSTFTSAIRNTNCASIPNLSCFRRRHQWTHVSYNAKSETNEIGTSTESNVIDVGSDSGSGNGKTEDAIIVSPALRLVYPDLLQYIEQYGHPNIPLGSEAGRQCATLRRLRVQDKLGESDVTLLDSMNFIWHSLEDVYTKQKEYFDDFMTRLQKYRSENDGDISPPKKYKNDPELGAWVTALRRLHTVNEVDAEHVNALNELGFQWNSPRKCGSKFMQQYRIIQEQMEAISLSVKSIEEFQQQRQAILNESDMKAWIQAQQTANLSETRKHYMAQLVGEDWMKFGR